MTTPHHRLEPRRRLRRRRAPHALLAGALLTALVACGDGTDATDATDATDVADATGATDVDGTGGTTGTASSSATGGAAPGGGGGAGSVTLVAYDSFVVDGTSIGTALERFTAETGIDVEVAISGDAGTMVSKAALTAGNPEGDVMFGIDSTLLSRAVDAGVFEPHRSSELDALRPELVALAPGGEVTPVDYGDVCVNYDIAWFEERGVEPPSTLGELTDPAYRDLLVVENPASSSPGLAFLLATIAELGEDRWQAWWTDLRGNGVEVVDSWTDAYYDRFSGSSGQGPRPLVVSYGTSPPAEVLFADPPREDAPTAVVPATCFRQVEFAGVLRGAANPDAARRLVDFLAGEVFQREVALNLFVYPARTDVELPPAFTAFATQPDRPLTMDPDDIAANRERWVDEWTELVLR